jgi:ADP-ribose diphosphatase
VSDLDKPEGAKLGWKRLATTYPFSSRWLKLRQDRVHIEGQGEIVYTYCESRGAVAIVPVTKDGEIVLVRQYRYTVDDWCLEVPAGGLHDRQGDDLEAAVRDELREEIGATFEELEYITKVYSSVAVSDEVLFIYLAFGVALTEQPHREITEIMEVHPTHAKEALHMARTGQINNGLSALALLLCEERLRERGYG